MALLKFMNLSTRKKIQYALIFCIFCIQIFVALFFWNEFENRKNTNFIEEQLQEVETLGYFTDNSEANFNEVKNNFEKYLKSKDKADLEAYYKSISELTSGFNAIDSISKNSESLNAILKSKNKNTSQPKTLDVKKYLDSISSEINKPSNEYTTNTNGLKKYKYEYPKTKQTDIETKTYSDSIKKKGLFGRIKDAISSVDNVRKDSTVVTLREVIEENSVEARRVLDSLLNNAHNYYTKEAKKVEINITNQNSTANAKQFEDLGHLYSLLNYSSNMMGFYNSNLKSVRDQLQNELNDQRLKNDDTRFNYALAAMLLMFLVSLMMLYFTRLTFFYEKELRVADKMNQENLNFKNRILGMLSHELRSPLKIIGLFVNRIQKKTDDSQIKEYLKSIHFTSNTLLLQSNQILEYTKNQEVNKKLVPTEFNLKSEVVNILESLEPYVDSRNNQFITNINIDSDINIFSDNTKINQLFFNIVGNANKFTENGKITVNSSVMSEVENKITFKTEVIDTGSGISEEDLKNIFEPYYQGVLSNDVENIGAGLGLSLCKEITQLFEGDLNVSSEKGKGTKVTFVLQLESVDKK